MSQPEEYRNLSAKVRQQIGGQDWDGAYITLLQIRTILADRPDSKAGDGEIAWRRDWKEIYDDVIRQRAAHSGFNSIPYTRVRTSR
jgi:hypothetical protein